MRNEQKSQRNSICDKEKLTYFWLIYVHTKKTQNNSEKAKQKKDRNLPSTMGIHVYSMCNSVNKGYLRNTAKNHSGGIKKMSKIKHFV